jgi:hypothetical protein
MTIIEISLMFLKYKSPCAIENKAEGILISYYDRVGEFIKAKEMIKTDLAEYQNIICNDNEKTVLIPWEYDKR